VMTVATLDSPLAKEGCAPVATGFEVVRNSTRWSGFRVKQECRRAVKPLNRVKVVVAVVMYRIKIPHLICR
jgi:hypothetical protein